MRVLSSSEGSAATLREADADEVLVGRFDDPRELDCLLAGVGTVLHIPRSVMPDEDAIGTAIIAAAERASIGHYFFMSCYHLIIPELRHHVNKLAVERPLIRSRLRHTVVQPAMFMQNLGSIWTKVRATGILEWLWDSERRYTMVDVIDVAGAMAAILGDDRFVGGTYEMCSGDGTSGG